VNNTILNHQEIEHRVKRIAFQIYENNSDETELILAGIESNGYLLAKRLKQELDTISDIRSTLCKVKINKANPLEPAACSLGPEDYSHKAIVLVDDVLKSGETLIYGIKHFLDVPLKRFKTAVLVDRNHKKYPVKVDFKGISLSTSLHEHVRVNLSKKPYAAHLD